jgi:glycosyltransferase involved in cell wall biosynthesis
VEELIAAYRQVADNSTRLLIGGRPILAEYAAEVTQLASGTPEITLWLRRLEEEELHLLLAAADAVVLPYRAILTSGALVLAMGAGRACIAPRMGMFEEHLGDGGGILYEPGNIDALAAALREAVSRREALDTMGERNRAVVAEWSPEAVGAQMAEIIRRALTAQGKRTP